MTTVTVYYDRSGMTIDANIAERFGLQNGSVIKAESLFWQVLEASAKQGIADCEEKIFEQKIVEWAEAVEAAE